MPAFHRKGVEKPLNANRLNVTCVTLDLFEAAVLVAVRHEDWYPGLAARNLGRLLLLQAARAVCNGQVSPALAETFIVSWLNIA